MTTVYGEGIETLSLSNEGGHIANRSSCQAARRAVGHQRLRNAASGGTLLASIVSFLVWRIVVAGGPQLSSVRKAPRI
jgi:hypothetical protein